MAARPQLAVATSFAFGSVHDSSTHARGRQLDHCGFVKWCHSASLFAKLPFFANIGGAEVVVLTDAISAAREECAASAARYMLYDAALKREVAAWAPERRRTKRMPDSDFSTRALLKWQLVGLLEYTYVFYTDIDTDLFFDTAGAPPPRGSRHWGILERAWTTRFDAFKAGGDELIASQDAHSPINTGVMLLKPSASTYELGRQALRSGRFNLRRGWNFTGPPQRVLPLHSLQAPFGCVGSPLFRGRTLTCAEWAQDELNHTVMVRENEWDFVGGDADQGLFTYIYLVVLRGRSFRLTWKLDSRLQCCGEYQLRHFWGRSKPWVAGATGPHFCAKYFDFVDHASFAHPPTKCLAAVRRSRESPETLPAKSNGRPRSRSVSAATRQPCKFSANARVL